MRATITVVHVPWRAPLLSAYATGAQPRPLVLLALESGDGLIGYGEAAPLQSYDGVTLTAVLEALKRCEPVLAAAEGEDHHAILTACGDHTDLPQALAAVDLALWDLAGRRAGQPVWELLGADGGAGMAINAVVGAVHPDSAAEEAARAVAAGFRCVKIKVGAGDDLARVRAVRDAVGPHIELRVDANGAWETAPAAVAALAALSQFSIEVCEEPVHGANAMAAVTSGTDVSVAVDESIREPGVFTRRVADLICLKVAACGGVTGVLRDAQQARELGYEVFLASTLDGPLGIAAALHAGAALQPDRACGLSTLDRFAPQPPPSLRVTAGRLAPPGGSGLGDGLRDWYTTLAASER